MAAGVDVAIYMDYVRIALLEIIPGDLVIMRHLREK